MYLVKRHPIRIAMRNTSLSNSFTTTPIPSQAMSFRGHLCMYIYSYVHICGKSAPHPTRDEVYLSLSNFNPPPPSQATSFRGYTCMYIYSCFHICGKASPHSTRCEVYLSLSLTIAMKVCATVYRTCIYITCGNK